MVCQKVGIHPALLGGRRYQILRMFGLDDHELRRILRSIHDITTWQNVWAVEGERFLGEKNLEGAFLCYYIAQRPLLTPSAEKTALYEKAEALYTQLPHKYPVQSLQLEIPGGRISGIIQGAENARESIIMIPGVTLAKEEMHYFADAYLKRGYRVCRIDNPGYGSTLGTLQTLGTSYPLHFTRCLQEQFGIHPVHLFGLSFGGWIALKNASTHASVATISAPVAPHLFIEHLPAQARTALQVMTGLNDMVQMGLSMESAKITAADLGITPIWAVHGGRDRTVPVQELNVLADLREKNVTRLLYPKEQHGCIGHLEDIWAGHLTYLREELGTNVP